MEYSAQYEVQLFDNGIIEYSMLSAESKALLEAERAAEEAHYAEQMAEDEAALAAWEEQLDAESQLW